VSVSGGQNLSCDVLVVGAGIIGLTVARELLLRDPSLKVVVLEKEDDVARHASGRNSGVLHAGFYYSADSLKARFTAEGNRAMKEYCREHNLVLNECHKVVVVREEAELPRLHELARRGAANGVEVELIDEQQLRDIEPNARTVGQALFSPATATVAPKEVCKTLREDLEARGATFLFREPLLRILGERVLTPTRSIVCGHLINAAGLHADRVAHQLGVGRNYTVLPFKGVYYRYTGDPAELSTNVYPVPDLVNPFLGVHFTKMADGAVKIGPTAIPGFWREQYQGLQRFSAQDLGEVLGDYSRLWWRNAFGFRALAMRELRKYQRGVLETDARRLVHSLPGGFEPMPAGIRAQLLDRSTSTLVMDFAVEYRPRSTHVLNAVSPAFTCSFSFSRHVVDHIIW